MLIHPLNSLPRPDHSPRKDGTGSAGASARFSCAVISTLAMLAQSAAAQRLSLSPTIGVYIPTSELVKAASGEEFKQEIGLAVGGRIGLTLSPRFGIESSVTYVPSNLRFTFDETQTTTDASLLFGTARATLHVIP